MTEKTLEFIKNKRYYQKCWVAMFALVLCFGITASFLVSTVQAVTPSNAATVNTLQQTVPAEDKLSAAYYALPGFSSSMPIIVLDMQGNTIAQDQYGYFLNGRILAFSGNNVNALNVAPSLTQAVKVRNMTDPTNQSTLKNDYFLRFLEPQGLLGMNVASEYLLLGAKSDKSLIRNYLGYTIAQNIVQGAPGVKLCEVFLRTAQGDLYQGVYTLVEKPTNNNAVMFHRSIDGDGIVIETYSTMNDPEAGKISIPFMQSTQWRDSFNESIGGLSSSESSLYSTNPTTFYTSADLFDDDSFADNFLLGELTGNYAGMYDAYYYYNTKEQVLAVAPIWNFEQAFDNQPDKPAVINQIYYDEAPYYKQFFKSPKFAKQIQENNLVLRKSVLDEAYLNQMVTDAVNIVAQAVQRDWQRWDGYKNYPLQPLTQIQLKDKTIEKVEPFARETKTYEEEILRLRYYLREHNLDMSRDITVFDFSEQEINKEIVLNRDPIWPVAFLIVFFLLLQFARRYGV